VSVSCLNEKQNNIDNVLLLLLGGGVWEGEGVRVDIITFNLQVTRELLFLIENFSEFAGNGFSKIKSAVVKCESLRSER